MDSLLGIAAKSAFETALASYAREARENTRPLSLVFLDIDHFKQVNDSHGHPIGDQVLAGVARVLREVVSGKGEAFRCGGEELVVILPNHNRDEAVAVAERVRVTLEAAILSEKQLRVTASLGVASLPEHAADAAQLYKMADQAMYDAKRLGRNLVRIIGEPEPTSTQPHVVPRREPDSGHLTAQAKDAIRKLHLRGGQPVCPNDETLLRVSVLREIGMRVPAMMVYCDYCGLADEIEGRE